MKKLDHVTCAETLASGEQVSYVVDVITARDDGRFLVARADLTESARRHQPVTKTSDALGVFEGATLSHECGFWFTGAPVSEGTARRDVGVAQVTQVALSLAPLVNAFLGDRTFDRGDLEGVTGG